MMITLIININDIDVYNNKPSKVNYLGLAELGVIPTTSECTHSSDVYDSTNVGMMDRYGDKYLIMQSKFGDESCLTPIS